MLKVVVLALASIAVHAAPITVATPSASDDATDAGSIDQRLTRLRELARVKGPLTLQSLQDMNPEKTKEQCEKCTNAQSVALEKETEAEPIAEALEVALEAVVNAEDAEKAAIEKEKAALDAYNKANEELEAAKESTEAAKKEQSKAVAAEEKAKEEVADAMAEVKSDCVGMNLDMHDPPPPSPAPPPHTPSPPPPPPPLMLPESAAEATYIKTLQDGSMVADDGHGKLYMGNPHGGANQKFYISNIVHLADGNYYFYIRIVSNSNCVDDGHGKLYMGACHGGLNQQFFIPGGGYPGSAQGTTTYAEIRLRSKPGECVDMHMGNNDLFMHACHGGSNQKFIFSN